MQLEVITSWRKTDKYKDWIIEEAVPLKLDEPLPERPTIRARKTNRMVFAPAHRRTKEQAIMWLYEVIDVLQMEYSDRIDRPRKNKYFENYEDALRYAKLRIAAGYATVTAHIGTNLWRFNKTAGEVVGWICKRNVI